jgi:hypothetical protein
VNEATQIITTSINVFCRWHGNSQALPITINNLNHIYIVNLI